jgi:hypothetical protein
MRTSLVTIPASIALLSLNLPVAAEAFPSYGPDLPKGVPTAARIAAQEASPARRTCRPGDLRIRAGRESDGSFVAASATVQFENVSASACTLRQPPHVTVLRPDGTPLAIRWRRAPHFRLTPQRLAPGASRWTAVIGVVWENWCRPDPGPLEISVRLGGARTSLVTSFQGPPAYDFVPGCGRRSDPSVGWLMSAYRPF